MSRNAFSNRTLFTVLAAASVFFYCLCGIAEESGYKSPSPALAALVDAPGQPRSSVSPDGKWMAFFRYTVPVPIEELSAPEYKLAGLIISPNNLTRARTIGYDRFQIGPLKSSDKRSPALPEGKILSPRWSPDSKHMAFVLRQADRCALWLYTPSKNSIRQLCDRRLNSILQKTPFHWSGDSESLLANLAGPETKLPQESLTFAPLIQSTAAGKAAPVRSYQNLLKTPYDKTLFEFFCTSQPARIDLNGIITPCAPPGIYTSVSTSPDGQYLLLSELHRPFSYTVPYYRFPKKSTIYTANGKKVRQIEDLPLAENIPQGFDSCRTGKRNIHWRLDQPATLCWVEATDGGDMRTEQDTHDHIYLQAAPFEKEPKTLLKLNWRYSGISWGDENCALISEWRFSDRQTRSWLIAPSNPEIPKKLFEDRGYNDAYKDPGTPITRPNHFGCQVIYRHNGYIYFKGKGASPKGNIPFLDRYKLTDLTKERIWHSEAPWYERILYVINNDVSQFVTLREGSNVQPNYFLRSLKNTELQQLSFFPHPTPQFQGIKKELIRYQRNDGVELSATLYLPPDHKEDDPPRPTLLWAYPHEYKDKKLAGQLRQSPYAFKRISYWGPMPFLCLGFAVLDGPTMPIVGSGDENPNDTFIPQLVSSAEAAVKTVVDKGIADPNRIYISGHSYGAFMVANLLAHSDLFAAGIARSGAYNRSLTPFGFQGEERTFWEAQSTYATMSPFFQADKINEPILLIHGAEDSNSGTYPIQSERLFSALKGLGKEARLVMFPHEGHGYRARESLLHLLYEQEQWLAPRKTNQQ